MTDKKVNGRAVLLDFDGTLVDSITVLFELYKSFLSSHGIEGTEEEFSELNGPSLTEVAARLKKKYAFPESESEILNYYVTEILKAYNDRVEAMPGAAGVLETLSAGGWRLAIVTSNKKSIVDVVLKRLGLENIFEEIITGDDVEKSKPEPEIYLKAIRRLGLPPAATVAVEDSYNGVMSASRAGCRVIGISPENDGEKLIDAGAAATIISLKELPETASKLVCPESA